MEDDDFPDDADLVRLLHTAKRAGYGTTEDDGGGNFEEAHFFDIVWRGVTRVIDEPAATDEDPLTCVVRGVGRILDDLTKYRTVLVH